MIIDVHTHFFPEAYLDLIEREGGRYGVELTWNRDGDRELRLQGILHPPLRAFYDIEIRLGDMEAMGVDLQVIHHSSRPNVLFADPGLVVELCRASNDAYAELMKAHPEKFIGMGVLPVQAIDRAVSELEKIKALGLPGVMLPSNVNEVYLGSQAFAPLYEALDASGMAVFVHPIAPAGVERMRDYRMWNGVGFPLEPPYASGNCFSAERSNGFRGSNGSSLTGEVRFPIFKAVGTRFTQYRRRTRRTFSNPRANFSGGSATIASSTILQRLLTSWRKWVRSACTWEAIIRTT